MDEGIFSGITFGETTDHYLTLLRFYFNRKLDIIIMKTSNLFMPLHENCGTSAMKTPSHTLDSRMATKKKENRVYLHHLNQIKKFSYQTLPPRNNETIY